MLAVVGVIALTVLGCAVALWPRGQLPKPGAGQTDSTRLVAATLVSVARNPCPEADPGVPGSVCIKVTARLAGDRQVSFDTTDPTGGMFRAGQKVRLAVAEQLRADLCPHAPPVVHHRYLAVGAASATGRGAVNTGHAPAVGSDCGPLRYG